MQKLLSFLPEELKGRIDYHFRPELARAFGPLNNQNYRQELVRRLLDVCDVSRIVETGTFRGASTAFFAELKIPVITVEVNPRYYVYSKLRLRKLPNVIIVHQDSVQFLQRELLHYAPAGGCTLFYLDAHWYANLPVREEVAIICTHVEENVVVIDDFKVPGDEGYGFDDYGEQGRLDLDYLNTVRSERRLMAFFPSVGSAEETGARRGSCVVTSNAKLGERLKAMPELRFFGSIGGRQG